MMNQYACKELAKIAKLNKGGMKQIALEQIDSYLLKNPHSVETVDVLSDILMSTNDFQSTITLLKEFSSFYSSHPPFLLKLAEAYLKSGQLDLATETGKEYGRISNGSTGKFTLLTTIYERHSQTELARESFNKVILNDKNVKMGWRVMDAKILIQEKNIDEAIQVLNSTIEDEYVNLDARVDAGFALAKVYNKAGEYDKAWESATKSHRMNAKKFDITDFKKRMNEIFQYFTRENLDSWIHASEPSQRHLFIVGMPRTGTSLIEQILSMHPEIENAGELTTTWQLQKKAKRYSDSFLPYPKCLVDLQQQDVNRLQGEYFAAVSDLSKTNSIVTNKLLLMHQQMGFVSMLLPDCKKILLTRNPLDNCVSCYLNNLIVSGHTYCSNLDDFATIWLLRAKAREHWKNVFGDRCIEMSYESLVANQEEETKRLLSYLDVPWNENCLEFHKSKRVAVTISYDQVNKKMYNTSKGRWANYEKYLAPVMERFEEYM